MNSIKAHKNFLATLLLALMALIMLPGCSTSDESSDSSSSSDCNCAEGDWNCKDRCTQPGD